MCLYPLNTKFSADLQTPKNLATLLIGEGKRGEFVLGIGLRCAFGRDDVALWGLGNSFCIFRGKRLLMGGWAVAWVKRLPRILFGLQ